MLVTESGHRPLLFSVSGSSEKDPTHGLPKLPVSAIIRASAGVKAAAETPTVRRQGQVSRLRPETGRAEPDRHVYRRAGTDDQRVRRHAGHDELGRRRADVEYRERTRTGVVDREVFFDKGSQAGVADVAVIRDQRLHRPRAPRARGHDVHERRPRIVAADSNHGRLRCSRSGWRVLDRELDAVAWADGKWGAWGGQHREVARAHEPLDAVYDQVGGADVV